MSWNTKLKKLRKQKGWTMEETAEKCNVAYRTYWLWENGKVIPTRASKVSILNAFNFTNAGVLFEDNLENTENNNDIEKIVLSVDYDTAKKLYEQLSKKI